MHREIRIYMPNFTDVGQVEKFKDNQPFLMKADVPLGSRFLGVVAIPSIVDMMGFSGGGGPPGYAYAVDPDQEESAPTAFMAIMPNKALPKGEDFKYEPLGVTQNVGLLFGHFKVGETPAQVELLVAEVGRQDGVVVDMIPYEPPPLLRSLYNPAMEKRLGGEEEQGDKPEHPNR